MGFEILFKYYKQDPETGNYDKNSTETLSKKLGKATDEVSMDALASLILQQMSRRDIWIYDVEINEFVRKRLDFKQDKNGGIKIGGKKFGSSPIVPTINEEDEDEVEDPQLNQSHMQTFQQPQPQDQLQDLHRQMVELQNKLMMVQPQQPMMQQQPVMQQPMMQQQPMIQQQPVMQQPIMQQPLSGHPLRFEFFKPNADFIPLMKAQGLRLTPNKQYGVFREKIGPKMFTKRGPIETVIYTVLDDQGKHVDVSSMHFISRSQPIDSTGEGILEFADDITSKGSQRLTHQGGSDIPDHLKHIPTLRR